MSTTISTIHSITLVTLQGSPSKIDLISEVFEAISREEINIDMISMSPTHGALNELSFTISDDDLIKTLKLAKELKAKFSINAIISSVNHKISIYDTDMKNTPGVAAKLFTALKATDCDLRLITTSEVEISLLVSEYDYDTVIDVINRAFE